MSQHHPPTPRIIPTRSATSIEGVPYGVCRLSAPVEELPLEPVTVRLATDDAGHRVLLVEEGGHILVGVLDSVLR
jgi:hypothetical protein